MRPTPPPGRPRPILVVDDDAAIRRVVAAVLADEGYTVAEAPDGGAALARARAAPPRLILLDMRMPGMDGWEFAREFRTRHGHGAPIIVVTAEASARRRAEEITADGFLGKPFGAAELMMTAQRHLPCAEDGHPPTG